MNFEHLEYPEGIKVSSQAHHLLERMLAKEQTGRYSAAEALRHPWITRELESVPPPTKAEKYHAKAEEFIMDRQLRLVRIKF
jgi:serine/threonine protein kinase